MTAGSPIDIQNMTAVGLTVQIGGQTYNENEAALVPWTVNPSGNFAVPGGIVTAVLNNGLILGSVGTGNNLFQFYLKVPPGQLALFFPQSDLDPSLYTFVGGAWHSSPPGYWVYCWARPKETPPCTGMSRIAARHKRVHRKTWSANRTVQFLAKNPDSTH